MPPPPPPQPEDAPITGGFASNPSASSRMVRLNHRQWENTVRDLLRLPEASGLSAQFFSEPALSSYDNNGGVLRVSPELWQDYLKAADTLGARVARDARLVAGLMPASVPTDPAGRARAFVQNLGLRAYRRPLTDAEVTRYLALFNQGATLVGSGDAFADGVEVTVSFFLQAPHFLYRPELGTTVVNGKVALNDYEVASKLSYGLTNTMPDDMLLAAAGARRLRTRDDIIAQARRLLDSAAGQATIADLHDQMLHMKEFLEVQRNPTLHPLWRPETGRDMRDESQAFIKDVVFDRNLGVAELLTAPYTFVNSRLAPLYGVTAPPPPAGATGDPLRRVDLDPARRAGIFTQVGFLATTANDFNPQIIVRGKRVNEKVLCRPLQDPPPGVSTMLPAAAGRTNRQVVEAATEQPGSICVGCHSGVINPPGYAFENYDGSGVFRTQDGAGRPINAASRITLAEGDRTFANAVEMLKQAAAGREAHECYSRQLLEYLYGREVGKEPSAADISLLREVGRRSRLKASIKALILDLVSTDAFVTRLP